MSLQNLSIASGGTISVAGGSAVSFTPKQLGGNTMEVQVTSDTDTRTRRTATFTSTAPKVNSTAPNGYTQIKNVAIFKKPKLLANGRYTTNSIQLSLFCDPETTDAEKQELLDFAAQCAFDADLTPFFKSSAVA